MITQKTVWVTSDGKEFATESDARAHVNGSAMRDDLWSMLRTVLYAHEARIAANYIIENRTAVLKALGAGGEG